MSITIPGYTNKKTKQDKFFYLLQMINSMTKADRDESIFQANATKDLIKVTNTLEGMEKLQNIVKEQDANFDSKGYDSLGDVNMELWGTKNDLMIRGQQGIKTLSSDFYNITNVEEKTNEILGMPWNEVSDMWQKTYGAAADIAQAKELGMAFKGVDPTLMLSKATQFDSMFKNALSVLAEQGVWEVPESMMEMTEAEFGVAMMTYDQSTFLRFMQDKERVSRSNIKSVESQMTTFYNQMINAQAQGGTSEATVNIGNFVGGQSYTASEYEQRYSEQKTLLQTLNSRHNNLYGNYASETPQALVTEGYGGGGSIFDEDVKNLKGAQKVSKKKDDEDKKDDSIEEYDRVNLPPAATISWDKDVNTVTIAKPETKETLIQKGLFKASSDYDIKQSLDDVEFRHNKDGKIINIARYDKKTNSYFDKDGNKYSEDEISINADSLVSFSPKLKKANGEYYFFDPTKNQFTKWGTSSSFGNQTMETFNGKKVPTVILKTKYGEGLVIGGKTIKGEASEKFIYHNGKWRHLKKINGKWKFINK